MRSRSLFSSPGFTLHIILLSALAVTTAFPGGGTAYAQEIVVPPGISSPAATTFPATPLGSTSPAVTIPIQIKIDGTTITSVSVPPSQGGQQEYTITAIACAMNMPLPPGNCNVTVTFTPAFPGERGVPLQVVTSDAQFNFGMIGLGIGAEVALNPVFITPIAGTGKPGLTGDGGPAMNATFQQPTAAVYDSAGNLYIADTNNNVIREVNAITGLITTIAGNGGKSYSRFRRGRRASYKRRTSFSVHGHARQRQ